MVTDITNLRKVPTPPARGYPAEAIADGPAELIALATLRDALAAGYRRHVTDALGPAFVWPGHAHVHARIAATYHALLERVEALSAEVEYREWQADAARLGTAERAIVFAKLHERIASLKREAAPYVAYTGPEVA